MPGRNRGPSGAVPRALPSATSKSLVLRRGAVIIDQDRNMVSIPRLATFETTNIEGTQHQVKTVHSQCAKKAKIPEKNAVKNGHWSMFWDGLGSSKMVILISWI